MFLPLFRKELIEQTSKRNYVIRFVYGLLFYLIFLVMFNKYTVPPRSYRVLGSGYELLMWISFLNFIGILVFLPAMLAPSIASERERSTLSLLHLTKLRTWEIFLEKFLAGILPISTLMFMSIPALGLAYSLGGVSFSQTSLAFYMLALTLLQVGGVALLCSCYFYSITEAMIAAYVFIASLYFGFPLLNWIISPNNVSDSSFFLIPFYIWLKYTLGPSGIFWQSLPILLSSIFFLAIGYLLLNVNFHKKTKSKVFNIKESLSFTFRDFLSLAKPTQHTLPGIDINPQYPISWRETKRPIVSLFLWLQIPTLLFLMFVLINIRRGDQMEIIGVGMLTVYCIVTLPIVVKSTNVFSLEHNQQTLDVLKTLPYSTKDILEQKLAGVNRLIWVAFLPILSIALFKTISFFFMALSKWENYPKLIYFFGITCNVFLAFSIIKWAVLWLYLRFKANVKTALFVIVAWYVLPFLMYFLAEEMFGSRHRAYFSLFSYLSPVAVISYLEFGEFSFRNYPERSFFTTLLFNGSICFFFRYMCLKYCNKYLNRE